MLDRRVVREFLDEELKGIEIPDDIFKEAIVETFCKYVEDDYYEWLKGNFPKELFYIWLENREPRLEISRLIQMINYSLQLNAVIVKRLGWMMEKVGVEDSILQQLEAIPIKGYRVLVPGVPRKGPCNKRWMIQENLLGRVIRTEVL